MVRFLYARLCRWKCGTDRCGYVGVVKSLGRVESRRVPSTCDRYRCDVVCPDRWSCVVTIRQSRASDPPRSQARAPSVGRLHGIASIQPPVAVLRDGGWCSGRTLLGRTRPCVRCFRSKLKPPVGCRCRPPSAIRRNSAGRQTATDERELIVTVQGATTRCASQETFSPTSWTRTASVRPSDHASLALATSVWCGGGVAAGAELPCCRPAGCSGVGETILRF